MDYYGNNDWRDYLAHYGTPRHSGRYPWGSGQNPRQGSVRYYVPKTSNGSFPNRVNYANPSGALSNDFPLKALYTNPDGSHPKDFPTTTFTNSNGFLFFKKKTTEPAKKYKPIPGLKLKTRHYTLEEDVAAVNPKNGDQNCMLCTTAFELRRRGHDVSAKISEEGFPTEDLFKWYKNVEVNQVHALRSWEDYFKNAEAATSVRGNVELEKAVSKDFKSQGVGARGNLMVRLSLYSGHSVAYEVTKKGARIYDTQQNQMYTEKETKKILRRVLGAEYARTDVADFNEDVVSQLVENRLTDTPEDYKRPGVRFPI